MSFLARWLMAVAGTFLVFPLAFALLQAPSLRWDLFHSTLVVLFLQFMSPWFWVIPLMIGTAVAVGWQIVREWKNSQSD